MALETGIDPSEAWARAKQQGKALLQRTQNAMAYLAANSVTHEYIVFDLYRTTRDINNNLKAFAATSGLNAYVQSVRGDAYDAVAAITAVTDACDAALQWIDAAASGRNLTADTASNSINNESVATNRYAPSGTAELRTMLDAIVAAIS